MKDKIIRFFKSTPLILFLVLISGLLFILIPEIQNRAFFADETFLMRTSYIQFFLKDIHPQLVTPFSFIIGIWLGWTSNFKLVFLGTRFIDLAIVLFSIWAVPRKITNSNWSASVFLLVFLLHPSSLYYLSQARYDTSIFMLSLLFLVCIAEKREFGLRSLLISLTLVASTLKGLYYFGAILCLFSIQGFFLTENN